MQLRNAEACYSCSPAYSSDWCCWKDKKKIRFGSFEWKSSEEYVYSYQVMDYSLCRVKF